MTSISLRIATALLMIVAVGAPLSASAQAQKVPAARIAILDNQRIMRESSAAIDIKSQIDRQRQKYQDEITKKEQELRKTDQELARQRTILSPEAFAKKRSEFESRYTQVQRDVQARKRELDQAYEFGLRQIQKAISEIIVALAKEREFNIVLPRTQVIFAEASMNITDDVLLRLNQKLPKVAIPLSQNTNNN